MCDVDFRIPSALISLSDAEYEVDALPQPFSPAVLRRVLVAWPAVSIGVGVAGLAFFSYQAFSYQNGSLQCRVGYDANLMALKDPAAESVKAERALEASNVDTVLYAVSVASTWEQASDLRAKYLRLPSVARVSDLASKLPDRPDEQTMRTIRDLQARASSLRTSLPNIPQADFRQVGKSVDQLFMTIRKSKNPAANEQPRTSTSS